MYSLAAAATTRRPPPGHDPGHHLAATTRRSYSLGVRAASAWLVPRNSATIRSPHRTVTS